jgi:hypothetical protein
MTVVSTVVVGNQQTTTITARIRSLDMQAGHVMLIADKETPDTWKLEVWLTDDNAIEPPSVFKLPVTREDDYITCWNTTEYVMYEMGRSFVFGEPKRDREIYVDRADFLTAIGLALRF